MLTESGELDLQTITRWLLAHRADIEFGVIELATPFAKQGLGSTFITGLNAGRLEGILAGLRIPYSLVRPAAWSKMFPHDVTEQVDRGLRKRLIKNARADLVRKWFPKVDFRLSERCRTLHDGMVDATLIAVYGRETKRGING